MKRVFVLAFSLLIGLGSALSANATHRMELTTLTEVNIDHQEVFLSLDIGDMTSKTETEISKEISEFLERGLADVEADLTCKVSVKGRVSVGLASLEITVEVSGPCSEISAQGTQIANQILNEVKRAIQAI